VSDNAFREFETPNPYAAPSGLPDPLTSGNPLLVPAIVLLVLSSLFLLIQIAALPNQIVRLREVDTSTPEGAGEMVGGVVAVVVWAVATMAVIVGSICMLLLKGYRSAFSAAVLSAIPLCSPCFVVGIPFGIWALILLRRPAVRHRFR